ncbi:NAD(P)H-dependent oxidoreductase subunit E [Chloroflexota bacterium]
MTIDKKQVQKTVNSVLNRYGRNPSLLVSILQDVQEEYRFLPVEALKEVSARLEVPLSRVYSVSTFFKAFSLTPRGKHLINVCMGTACHVRGSVRILGKLERDLGIKAGGTTKDLNFTLETVNCVGACALGPMVVINGRYHGQMSTDKVESMLNSYTGTEEK